MLRPSFVPLRPIRVLRDYTRLRIDLTRERTRYWQRLEKLLEDSLIKVSSVASGLDTISARDMVKALIRGERDPHAPAGLARGRMRTEHAELIEALTGAFDAHHGELARIMLDQVDALTRQIDRLTTRIDELIAAIPAAEAAAPDGNDPGDPATRALPAVQRLAEIPVSANPVRKPSWPKWDAAQTRRGHAVTSGQSWRDRRLARRAVTSRRTVGGVLLIFGFRSKDRIVGSRIGRCEVCGATAAQTLVRRTTKFSLFFVPLFPVRAARYFLTCTNCGRFRAAAREEFVAA
jgi:hypothetical protein